MLRQGPVCALLCFTLTMCAVGDAAKVLLFFVNSASDSLPRAAASSAVKQYFESMGGHQITVTSSPYIFNRGSFAANFNTSTKLTTPAVPGTVISSDLLSYDAVVFFHTSDESLDQNQRDVLQEYVRRGKGFAAIGASCDQASSSAPSSAFDELIGSRCPVNSSSSFVQAPQLADVLVNDRVHPSSKHLPQKWNTTDLWLDFEPTVRRRNHVLLSVIEKSYKGGRMGIDHPISWCKAYSRGRSWYTALGNTPASWTSENTALLSHVGQGIAWAAGVLPGNCNASLDSFWEKQVVDANVKEPMQLAPAPSGKIFFIERGGSLKVFDPETSATSLAGRLTVSNDVEDGLLGIGLDPAFNQTGWVYLYYSPKAVIESRLSRFTIQNDKLLLDSEKIMLRVPTQRKECCHSGGGIIIDPTTGFLYLSLGDNTSPYGESDSFAPLDERDGRENFDAQRTSANTMDLRGKILRILPQPDGGYAIPATNLFANAANVGRPEIYVMGVRNAFRFNVDVATGTLFWAEVGPNSVPDPKRGPLGVDEVNRARSAGNFGWPYCIGPNWAYRNWDYKTRTSTRNFDCANLQNNSPHLDKGGSHNLPPARPAILYYGYPPSEEFPQIHFGITSPSKPGRCAFLGPYIRNNNTNDGSSLLPAYYDNTMIFMEWRREYILEMKMDENGDIAVINPMWPSYEWWGPIDMKIARDGWIYVAEYGTDFEGLVRPARITRLRYTTQPKVPICDIKASVTSGVAPLEVQFSAADSRDQGNLTIRYTWTFETEPSIVNTTEAMPSFTYMADGVYNPKLQVINSDGAESSCTVRLVVGNTAPVVSFVWPLHGGIYEWADELEFEIEITDAEETPDCSLAQVQPSLGHDNHYHTLITEYGCKGKFQTLNTGHEGDANLFYGVEARYLDAGGPKKQPSLEGSDMVVLQPKRKEAEAFTLSSLPETSLAPTDDVDGYSDVLGLSDGDFLCYSRYNLWNIWYFSVRAAVYTDVQVTLRMNTTDGAVLSNIQLTKTTASPDAKKYGTFTADVNLEAWPSRQTASICVTFVGGVKNVSSVDLNWISLSGPGVASRSLFPRPNSPAAIAVPTGGGSLAPDGTPTAIASVHLSFAAIYFSTAVVAALLVVVPFFQ